jgi:predicted O-linked N-acetylglucosamine transferase (SPINDLY family)
MDISLDPFPYAGTTTTCEATLMGVPTITLRGDHHAHNVGVSLLSHLGHSEWVADSVEQYVARAVALASDIPALAAIRAGLRDEFLGSPLCDGKSYVAEVEQLFRELWGRWCDEHDTEGEIDTR